MGNSSYVKPAIQTVPASRIVELMGPVSCGSHRPVSSTADMFVPRRRR